MCFIALPLTFCIGEEAEIPFEDIADNSDLTIKDNTEVSKYYDLVECGQSFSTKHPKGHFFGDYKANPKEPLNTIRADPNHGAWHPTIKRMINFNEAILGGSYAMDYDFTTNNPKYLVGMSVPPVMTAQIATEVFNQWLCSIRRTAISPNVLGLGEEGEIVVQMLIKPLKPNSSTMFKVCTSAPFLPNPCYRLFFFSRFVNN